MTTRTWSTTSSCSSDAEFRALGLELNTYMTECGMVQTPDTGQINWATVLKPAANTFAGYEMWRFNDALQSTAPIFVKFRWGTVNGNANVLQFAISVGTGTDGAGNLTGIIAAETPLVSVSWGGYTPAVKPSYLCYKDGFLGLAHKVGVWNGANDTDFGFAICRTVDAAGAWTGDGVVVYGRGTGGVRLDTQYANVQSLRFASTAQAFALSNGGYSLVPHARTAAIGADNPVYLNWAPMPDMVPVLGICTYVCAQYSSVGTFQATLVGGTPRTYLSLGGVSCWMGRGAENPVTSYGLAMLWE